MDWLTDETRETIVTAYAATIRDRLIVLVEIASIDAWDGTKPPLIICEARRVKAVLQSTA
jgi:hypothetical protein